MEDMIHHSAAVARGIKKIHCSSPTCLFMFLPDFRHDAVVNAGRLMKERRAQAVKLKEAKKSRPQIKAIVDAFHPCLCPIYLY